MILRLRADATRIPLADGSVHAVCTSPPYFGLRAYAGVPPTVWPDGWRGTLGNEPTVEGYVAHLVACFLEVRRVLRDDGVCWTVLGDSYGRNPAKGQHKPGDSGKQAYVYDRGGGRASSTVGQDGQLLGVPWRVGLALQADGWIVRNDVVWCKTSAMPESVSGVRWERCRVKVASVRPGNNRAASTIEAKDAGSDVGNHPSTIWRGCPGCETCTPNDGLVLRRGSWRHTRAHETVLMLTKTMGYYCDAEAVKEPVAESSLARVAQAAFVDQTGGEKDYMLGVNRSRSERRTLENFAARVADGTAGRNPRSYMLLGPAPLRAPHFAAFPTALIEPLIKVSTSARGVCSACGAPWARVVDRCRTLDGERADLPPMRNTDRAEPSSAQGIGHGRTGSRSYSLGWRRTCEHADAPAVPAVVLDPFAGSGTTGRVALSLGRRVVLCDMSRTYLRDIADRRTRIQLPLDATMITP